MAKAKATSNKLGVGSLDVDPTAIGVSGHERNEERRSGRPIGRRGNPAIKQYSILIRMDVHDRAVERLRTKIKKPDFGEYVESLIAADLAHS